MHISPRLAITSVLSAVVFLVPFTALASGIDIYDYVSGNISSTIPADVYNQIIANDDGQSYDAQADGFYGDTASANKLCRYFSSTASMASMTTANYVSPGGGGHGPSGHEWLLQWSGSLWNGRDATNGNIFLKSGSCIDYSAPSNTLSVSNTSITAGQSVTLTWSDGNTALDQYWGVDTSHGSYSAGYADPAGPPTTCTSSGFSLPTTSRSICANWSTTQTGTGCGTQALGKSPNASQAASPALAVVNCTTSWVCKYSSGLSAVKTDVQTMPSSGSVTVTPSTTTTYSYTCSSPNGTTSVSKTVTVGGSPVNGVCGASHYLCSAGSSSNNVNGSSAYTWSCVGSNGGSTASCSEGKGSSLPDLVPDSPSDVAPMAPASPTTATPITFYGGVINSSQYPANNFPSIIQVVDSSQSTTIAMIAAGYPNGSATMSLPAYNVSAAYPTATKTITTAGSYYYRWCANFNTSWGGSIPESTTSNNCGSWVPFTVSVPAPPTISSFAPTSSTATVKCGQQASLTWSSNNATSCTGTGFSTGGATSNATGVAVTPTDTPQSNYQISCTNGTATAYATASVNVVSPTAAITASPARVASGGPVSVTWTASDVKSCAVTRNGVTIASGNADGSGNYANTASPYADHVSAQTTYVISCTPSASAPPSCTNNSLTKATAIANVVPDIQNF